VNVVSPCHVQRYEQVVASRNRLAAKLSDANRYTTYMEAELAGRSADVGAAATSLSEVSRREICALEFQSTASPDLLSSFWLYTCVWLAFQRRCNHIEETCR